MGTTKGQVTVRISEDSRELLRWLSEKEGRSMQAVLRAALEVYRRQRFLDEVNAGYEELRRDAPHWEAWTAEAALWDRTLSDGLAAEPQPSYGVSRSRRKKRE